MTASVPGLTFTGTVYWTRLTHKMSKPRAPSMPTAYQIKETQAFVSELYPGARIKAVALEGVVFSYPD